MRERFDDWRARLGLALLGIAGVLLVAAIAVPLMAFPHDADHLSDATKRYTIGQAKLMSDIPPLRLQIVEAGPDPRQLAAHAESRLAWRTIFGIRYGTTDLGERGSSSSWDHWRLLGTLAAFAAAELALAGTAGWLLWTAP